LLFRKEHLDLPENRGEKRESLVIFEKVGNKEGLLKSLGTEGDVRYKFLNNFIFRPES
jgi:hypothetical protein